MNVALDCPKLWKLAMQVFGSDKKAALWFHTRLSELEDQTPADVLEREPESTEVEAILERIDYGVFN
jgi:putative toxin-antitoxin system antitoxin component (TIGR02293 family)